MNGALGKRLKEGGREERNKRWHTGDPITETSKLHVLNKLFITV